MEESRDELVLHQEDEIGASEEMGTTTPLDFSASALEQMPAQQRPLTDRVVLPLKTAKNLYCC